MQVKHRGPTHGNAKLRFWDMQMQREPSAWREWSRTAVVGTYQYCTSVPKKKLYRSFLREQLHDFNKPQAMDLSSNHNAMAVVVKHTIMSEVQSLQSWSLAFIFQP
jgi:hypothetical protein